VKETMMINKKIISELNKTRLQIERACPYKEDYQLRMLQENHLSGMLGVIGYGSEEQTIYEYDISDKTSLNQKYDKKRINTKEMKKFLNDLSDVLEELENYLLNPNSVLMDPDYIYWEKGKYYFCYIPGWEADIGKEFHKLMDCFVQWTDYQDVPSVKLAFLLHKETMEQNYSLKKVIEKMNELEKQKEKIKERKQKEENKASNNMYETVEHDWITYEGMDNKILRETDNMWLPVKRFLQKHSQPKWGDWDGIYIEEEEL